MHAYRMEDARRSRTTEEQRERTAELPPVNLTPESIAALVELGELIRSILIDSRYRYVDGRILPPEDGV